MSTINSSTVALATFSKNNYPLIKNGERSIGYSINLTKLLSDSLNILQKSFR